MHHVFFFCFYESFGQIFRLNRWKMGRQNRVGRLSPDDHPITSPCAIGCGNRTESDWSIESRLPESIDGAPGFPFEPADSPRSQHATGQTVVAVVLRGGRSLAHADGHAHPHIPRPHPANQPNQSIAHEPQVPASSMAVLASPMARPDRRQ